MATPEQLPEVQLSAPSPEGEVGSLEQPLAPAGGSIDGQGSKPKKSLGQLFKNKKLNPYLLAFVVILIVGAAIAITAIREDSQGATVRIDGAELTQEMIDELLARDVSIGGTSQTLTVEANAIFAGKVLIKDSIDVAGPINIGGSINMPEITVSGASVFNDVQVGGVFSAIGNASFQGTLNALSGLSVTGNGTFSGTLSAARITANSFEITGDLIVSRHIDTGGPTPSISAGGSVGAGGTVSISGTDTAGTITINTGTGASAGVLASINFAAAFSATPSVILSPASAAASQAGYFTSRSASSFSVRASSTPTSSATLIYDYFVIQ